jgi:exopolyphosphatase/guanosine-5'-triphosphate,3'-diphosphate pyrophosphatase
MPRYAAIDIGSNSVRMLAAECIPGSPARALVSDRQVIRLGESVFATGTLSTNAIDLACDVLRAMAAAYAKFNVAAVRAVATSAVRDASNRDEFVARASEAAGVSVEIISGQEEARLIHMGVQASWPHPNERVLIMDVGGGSAEFIVGENGELREGISRPLGAVRLTEVFLKHDPPESLELHRLTQFIDERFELAKHRLNGWKFDRMIVTSATAAAIVSAVNAIPRSERDNADRLGATRGQVRQLFRELTVRNCSERKKVPGLGPRRAEIIIAGVAAFLRVMELLDIESIYYSTAGVRDGIIADLAARGVGRELTRLSPPQLRQIEAMGLRYGVDLAYASRVACISAQLFDSLHSLHGLPPEHGKLLETAAYLHDVGHFISDTGHHKHSAYVVLNSDLPGYTLAERQIISQLCRYHRKSLPVTRHEPFRALPPDARRAVQLMTPLLRIAIGLNTSKDGRVREVECRLHDKGVTLNVIGEEDVDLEIWAAERAAESFVQTYSVPLAVQRGRT